MLQSRSNSPGATRATDLAEHGGGFATMLENVRELFQYRALLLSLIGRDLKGRYRGSVFGFLWTFLNPVLQMLVYSVVFHVYLGNGIDHYPYFLFVGLLPWN